MNLRRILALVGAALAVLCLQVACVDKLAANTAGAPLYVYDGVTGSVMVWSDISAVYDSGTAGTPDRTIKSSLLGFQLGWGGMVLDKSGHLYLVAATGGKVVRINYVGTQNGTIGAASNDIVTFKLDDSGMDLTDGTFGQAALDPTGTTLYVTETKGTKSQIWVVSNPAAVGNDAKITTVIAKSGDLGDSGCLGVAAGGTSSALYAYFNTGDSITVQPNSWARNQRLRKGTSSGFDFNSNVIVGVSDAADTTKLSDYGCLAYDTGNDLVYFGRQAASDPVLVFKPATFNAASPVDAAPDATLAGPTDLRVIAHAGLKDWLVGAESTDNTTGKSTLWIWKAPSEGDTHKSVSLTGVTISGLAFDGSN